MSTEAMRYLALAPLSLAISIVGAVLLINSGVLHDRMEQELRAKTGVPIELGRMQIPLQWPPTVLLHTTKVPTPLFTLEFKSVLVTLGSLFAPYDFRVYLREPKVVVHLAVGDLQRPPLAAAKPIGGRVASDKPAQFRLALTIVDGEFRAQDVTISKLNVEFAQKVWMRTPARLKASAQVRTQLLPGEWPVSVQTESLVIGEDLIKASGVNASFAGLSAVVQGTSLLKDGRHRWVAEVKAPDLSQVPAPPEWPGSGWRGAVEANVELTKETHDKPWAAQGHSTFKNVKADLKWNRDKLSVQGPMTLDAQGKFTYIDHKVEVSALAGVLDLEKARVEALGLLNKPPGTALRAEISADGSLEKLNIKKFEARLWQLTALIGGRVALKAPYDSKLSFDLRPTSLKGLESIITPLKNSLVQGELALQGEWTGPLADAWNSNLVARNFRLKNFSAEVNYDNGGAVKARGPIAVNLEAVGEIDKGKPKKFSAKGNMQLGGLALVAGPLRKEAKQPLSAAFDVEGDGSALQIDQMALNGFLGQIKLTGSVSEPVKPKLNMRLDLRPLDLSELRVALPTYHELIPQGSVVGNVGLLGEVATEAPWYAWPLTVSGSAKVSLPEYRIVSAPPSASGAQAPASGGAAGTPAVTEALLPKGFLTEKLTVQLGVSVGVLSKGDLTVKGVDAQGRISRGVYRGGVTLREIFGGKVTVSETEVPLLEARPKIHGRLALEQIVVQDVLAFAKPEYKSMATGRAAGQATFATRLPSDSRFIEELKANGQMNFEPITLNTVQIGALLNEMIKKVPLLKLPPAKVEPLKGRITADFSVESQAVTLSPLHASDVSGSELDLKGKVVVPTMQGDFVGNFYWVNPEVKGCLLQGNADAKGRLVVPLALKGSLLHPEMSMVSDTVNKLAGKALQCEKTKLVEQIKKDGGKKLEQEAKKVLKGILGN